MARNPRIRNRGSRTIMHITCRTRVRVIFPARPSIARLIEGILARGQRLYHIKIAAYVFMCNHYHMVVYGAAMNISRFTRYINTELSRVFRKLTRYRGDRLFPRRPREQLLATPEDCERMIKYVLLNPVRAGLCRRYDEYKGAISRSPWEEKEVRRVYARELREVSHRYSRREEVDVMRLCRKVDGEREVLSVDMFGWMKSVFGIRGGRRRGYEFVQEVLCEGERVGKGVSREVVSFDLSEVEDKRGEREPFLICSDDSLRERLIREIRGWFGLVRSAWQEFKETRVARWPRGCYIPSLASVLLQGMTVKLEPG